MASGGSWSSTGCSVRMSSPRGYAGLSGVRITGISPFHRRSLDHATREEPLAFSWRESRHRGAAWWTSGSLVPISGAPVGVYPRLHTLEEFRQLPRVLGPEVCQRPG